MDNQLMEVIKVNAIQDGERLMQRFAGYFTQAKEIAKGVNEIVVTSEMQIDLMQQAKEKRLELKKIRVEVENTRKELKEQSLREGRAIDGIANVIKALIVPLEEHLEKQEKYAELLEAKRIEEQYGERVEQLSKYVLDVSLYNLKEMPDDVFSNLLVNAKASYEQKIELEKKEEAERLEKEKQRILEEERIRKENEKLRQEAELKNKEIEVERAKQAKLLEDERQKREAIQEMMRKEKEEQNRKERERLAVEEANKKREEEAKRKALLAPDKDKLLKLASDFDSFVFPNVENRETGKVIDEAKLMLLNISKLLRERANTL